MVLAYLHRLDRVFYLLGLTYPDWSVVEASDAGGSKTGAMKKRKKAKVMGKPVGASKHGGRGTGGWGLQLP